MSLSVEKEFAAQKARSTAIKNGVIDERYQQVEEKEVYFRGRAYKERTYQIPEYGTTDRVASALTGKFREAKDGGTKKVYDESDSVIPLLLKDPKTGIEYDPRNEAQLRDFVNLDNIKSQLRQRDGHLYLPISGRSAFIHIANGDLETGKVSYIEMWKAGKGSPIKNTKEYYRAINTYIAAYDEIEEKWGEAADKLALRLTKRFLRDPNINGGNRINYDEHNEEHQRLLKMMRRRVDARKKTVVIDFKNKEARFYADIDPNKTNTSSYRTGTVIKFGDDLKKEIDSIFDANQNEVKGDLKGERPFENPIPDKND